MLLRIGINLGEVIYHEARIWGDGINIAARLENLTRPGFICDSRKVKVEVDEALRRYEKALTDCTPNMVYATILPAFRPELVSISRFQAIMDRMGLPRTQPKFRS